MSFCEYALYTSIIQYNIYYFYFYRSGFVLSLRGHILFLFSSFFRRPYIPVCLVAVSCEVRPASLNVKTFRTGHPEL